MDTIIALLPSLGVGLLGVPMALRLVNHVSLLHVIGYVAIYSAIAAGVAVWFALQFGTVMATVGGLFLALISTTIGLIVGLFGCVWYGEYVHRRRHQLAR